MIQLEVARVSSSGRSSVTQQKYNRKKRTYHFSYASKKHEELPHVVKFSGGRSSGMLLFVLLANKLLKAGRGDVVVFNNTSAEHPATYDFVAECKDRCEVQYGLPFLMTEFQTYEDASNGKYSRFPAYRLVNSSPYSKDNPNGYHCRGEVFEELISWQGFLPNQYKRTCTSLMKLYVSQMFLGDWFSRSNKIKRLGHFGAGTRINEDDLYDKHLSYRGNTPKGIYIEKKRFCLARPLVRETQRFSDYTKVSREVITNPLIKNGFSEVSLSGGDIEYCSFIGFRGDEPHRLAKLRERSMRGSLPNEEKENGADGFLSYVAEPDGEHVYAPLAEIGISKKDVIDHWRRQDWNLELPDDTSMSNCVYCFLKGEGKLLQIAQDEKNSGNRLEGTPASLNWWINLEQKYQRDLIAEERFIRTKEERPVIGFFGTSNKRSYKTLLAMKKMLAKHASLPTDDTQTMQEFNNLPCDCTD